MTKWDTIKALVLGVCFAFSGKHIVLFELLCTCAGCCKHKSILLCTETYPCMQLR